MLPQEYTGKSCFNKISNIELNVAITPIPTIKIESSLSFLLLSILLFIDNTPFLYSSSKTLYNLIMYFAIVTEMSLFFHLTVI